MARLKWLKDGEIDQGLNNKTRKECYERRVSPIVHQRCS
jgi:hypothetical protein